MTATRPRFSIVVPALAPPSQIADCLDAISRLAVPDGGFEVIVVDDGSPEPFDGVIERYRDRLDLSLIRQSNQGPSAARNAGARIARGEYLAFTDADCRPGSEWLNALASCFRDSPNHMLGGHTINRLEGNLYSQASQAIVDAVYAFYNPTPQQAQFFASNNLTLRAKFFHEIGGFDQRLFRNASEDRELCDRWLLAGHQMTYVPEAVVYHGHALTLPAFCRQHFNYGRGAWNYHFVRARRGSGPLRRELRGHFRLLSLLPKPLARMPYPRRLRMAPLFALWEAANAAGFCYEAWRTRGTKAAGKHSYATS